MLRNLLKIANVSRTQQFQLLQPPSALRALHSTSWIGQQAKNQPAETDKIRVYYGEHRFELNPEIKIALTIF